MLPPLFVPAWKAPLGADDCTHSHRRRHAREYAPARGQAVRRVLPGRHGQGWVRGHPPRPCLAARPDPARHHDAGDGRLRGLPPAQGRCRDGAYPHRHGDRPRRARRAAARPGSGRGRFPHQAGRIRHAAGAGEIAGAAEAAARRVAAARRNGPGARADRRSGKPAFGGRRPRPGGGRLGLRRADRAGRPVARGHRAGPRLIRGRGVGAHRRGSVRPGGAQPVDPGGGPAAPCLAPARERRHPGRSAAADRRARAEGPPAARLRPGRQRLAAAPD